MNDAWLAALMFTLVAAVVVLVGTSAAGFGLWVIDRNKLKSRRTGQQ